MNKNLKVNIMILLTASVLSTGVYGCQSKSQEKTIVIKESQSKGNENSKFELNKLTEIDGKGTIKGWFNEKELITSTATHQDDKDEIGRYKWLEIDSVNYSTLETKKISEDKFRDVVLSPDGTKLAYRREDNNKGIIGFIDLKSNKDTSIGEYDVLGPVMWSNNSRYISSIVNDGVIINDTETNELKKINITNIKSLSGFGNILVSDDGKHALIGFMSELYMLDITSNSTMPKSKEEMEKYKVSDGTNMRYSFLNNSQAIFTGAKGEISSLYQYNINSKEKKEVLENVTDFSLSANCKYITYTSDSTLYTGSFNDDKIVNSYVIFKGFIGPSLFWNRNNKEIVFQGSEQGNKNLKQYVAELK